jgi:hypothetical protein
VQEGFLGDLVDKMKKFEDHIRMSPNPQERQHVAAVGVVSYKGQAELSRVVQFAGILYHNERQAFLNIPPPQA